MADTPSSILLTREQATGSNTNLWGGYLITTQRQTEQAMKGYQTQALTGNTTITWSNYATGNIGQCAVLKLTGTLSSAASLTMPTYQNWVLVWNASGATVTVLCSAGTGVAVPNNRKALLFCDGVDYFNSTPSWIGDSTTLTNNGDLVSFTQLNAALAANASPATTGSILNSAADTTAGFLALKLDAAVTGLLTAVWSTENAAADEKSLISFDDRRLRRRAFILGGA